MTELNHQVAVVTGAGSGIGRALSIELSRRGTTVALADKDLGAIRLTEEAILDEGGRCAIHELDVSDLSAVEAFRDDVINEYGQVHLLFNNAGVTLIDSVSSQTMDSIKWLMGINFWGVVNCTHAFLPNLQQANEAHIVNVSSIFGMISVPGQSAYNASKFAVRGYTESLRQELLGSGLNVTCVLPGGVKTGIVSNSRLNPDVLEAGQSKSKLAKDFENKVKTTPEQAASQILGAVEHNKPRVIIGRDAKFMDLIGRLFPVSYDRVLGIRRKAKKVGASS